jgi:DNA-binding NarL/FixJ family response regulator
VRQAGASACARKSQPIDALIDAVRAVTAGRVYEPDSFGSRSARA